jgi:hypothetical protein
VLFHTHLYSHSKEFFFLLILLSLPDGYTGALSTPLAHGASKVRRDPPVPSAYPLGDASPNEWQYLNFDPENADDQAHLVELHAIFGYDLMELLASSEQSVGDVNAVYLRYFPPSDDEDDFQGHVSSVYNQMGTNGGASPLVATFIVDNLGKELKILLVIQRLTTPDFNDGFETPDQCSEGILAYTDTDDVDGREKIHFCAPAYTRPQLIDFDCTTLDTFPSPKMTHYSTVGPPSALGQQSVDTVNTDGFGAYDPDRTHGLIDPDQDDNPSVTEINADNYAWMALDGYMSFACTPTLQTLPTISLIRQRMCRMMMIQMKLLEEVEM